MPTIAKVIAEKRICHYRKYLDLALKLAGNLSLTALTFSIALLLTLGRLILSLYLWKSLENLRIAIYEAENRF